MNPAPDLGDLTRDEILRGRLALWQPRTGYRFSVDSLLLQHFVGEPPFGLVVDLCAGVGIIGLALLVRDARARATLVELQPRMAALARRNVEENGLAERAAVALADVSDAKAMRAAVAGASCELVVSSPPFFRLAEGPPVPDAEEAIARHELRLTLADLAREARRVLVEAVKGGKGGLAIEAPLVVRDEAGYTDEAKRALGET